MERKMSTQSTPAKKFHFHAACINAAKAGDWKGICPDCFKDAQYGLPPQRSVTAKYDAIMFTISLYKPDGAIDLGQCLDDGGAFDE
jgi:hypothetical protein